MRFSKAGKAAVDANGTKGLIISAIVLFVKSPHSMFLRSVQLEIVTKFEEWDGQKRENPNVLLESSFDTRYIVSNQCLWLKGY